jgi:hypothetical protein
MSQGVVVEIVACGHARGATPRQGAGAGQGEGPTVLGPKVEDADGNLPEVGASRVNEGAAGPPADAGSEGAGVGGEWGRRSTSGEGPPWSRDLVGYHEDARRFVALSLAQGARDGRARGSEHGKLLVT